MRVGSVDYVIIAFRGNRFTGEIVPALQELGDLGTVNIVTSPSSRRTLRARARRSS
jgi:hypothetical protein